MNSISFVIPAYNTSKYLVSCIESLKNQTVTTNISIATRTPNDHISQIAQKYSLPIFINQNSMSIGDDWNFALKSGTSDLIVLAHQDDIYDSKFSEYNLEFFRKYNDCAITFTDANELITDNLPRNKMREKVKRILRNFAFGRKDMIHTHREYHRLLAYGCPIPCPSVTYNMKILKNFAFSNKLTINLDWDAWTQIAFSQYRIGYIKKTLFSHRIHKNACTQMGIETNKRSEEDLKLFQHFWSQKVSEAILRLYKFGY